MFKGRRRINVGRVLKKVQEPAPVLDLPDIDVVLNNVAFVTALEAQKPDHFTVKHRWLPLDQIFTCSFDKVFARDHALIFDCISHEGVSTYEVAPGCSRLLYIAVPFDAEEHNLKKTAWTATFRREGGGLIDVFYRCHTLVPDHPIFGALGHLVTMASRPLEKCRFTGYDYFVPYPQFIYVGDAYR